MRAALVLLVGVCVPTVACAQPDRRTFDEASGAYAGCAAHFGEHGFPSWTDDDDPQHEIVVQNLGGRWLVGEAWFGNGVDGEHGGTTMIFDPSDCSLTRHSWGMADGSHLIEAEVRVVRGAPLSQDDRQALLRARDARPDAPEHGAARVWLQHRCARNSDWEWPHSGPGWEAFGPLVRAQPWRAGPPLAAPSTYWNAAQLGALGAARLLGTQGRQTGVIVPGTQTPRRVWSGGGYEIWAARLGGRNAGDALAVVDPAGQRHRWILLTRGCVNGTQVDWVSNGRGLLVGETQSRHPVYEDMDAVIAIELAEGRVWALSIPGEELERTHAGPAPNGVRLTTRNDSMLVTFEQLRRRIRARRREPAAAHR